MKEQTGLIAILIIGLLSCNKQETEIICSNQSEFTKEVLEFTKGAVNDIDGNTYKTIIIGNQEWMAENLKVTHYPDGSPMKLVEDELKWVELGDLSHWEQGAYCYYNNNSSSVYGALYSWTAATNNKTSSGYPSDVQGICPEGWYVPGDMDWIKLLMNLGMDYSSAKATGYNGTGQGSQLAGEEGYPGLWNPGGLKENSAFGSSGFNGLPGGYRDDRDGAFVYQHEFGLWWTSTMYENEPNFRTFAIKYSDPRIDHYYHSRTQGISVRCVRALSDTVTVKDVDGNIYLTLKIGEQRWMTQNLKTTRYANGMAIPLITDDSLWALLEDTARAYSFYMENDNSADSLYGALYTWGAVVAYDGNASDSRTQGICPDGWHVPSDDEWKKLEIECGMSVSEADKTGFRGLDNHVGSLLAGDIHAWYGGSYLRSHPEFGFTGFNARGAGMHSQAASNGKCGLRYLNGFWWTATETNDGRAWCRNISSLASQVNRKDFNKANGFSVRCVKDE